MLIQKCKITFIAHGSTIYNDSNRFADSDDYPPLNDVGHQQMQTICEFIKKRGVKNDKIFVSPALKALQSAEILSKELKEDFKIIDSLTPRKYGDWGGLTFEQVKAKYPEFVDKNYSEIFATTPHGGESLKDFVARVESCISNIIEANKGQRVLIITHPVIIRAAICSALKIPVDNMTKFYIQTGSASQISYYDTWAVLNYSGFMLLQ